MRAYILTWNSRITKWGDFEKERLTIAKMGRVDSNWSCGRNKSIKVGDRLYMVRQGGNPTGICASGTAISEPYPDQHWSGEPGKTANYVEISFDAILDPDHEYILQTSLLRAQFPEQQWSPYSSGISVKPEYVDSLDLLWKEHLELNSVKTQSEDSGGISNTNYEGRLIESISTRFERRAVNRKACLDHHGYRCQVCSLQFDEYYGTIGTCFIHVHHKNPLSIIRKEHIFDPLIDLVPLCPNCHAMIHKGNPLFTIDELREMVSKSKKDRRHQ